MNIYLLDNHLVPAMKYLSKYCEERTGQWLPWKTKFDEIRLEMEFIYLPHELTEEERQFRINTLVKGIQETIEKWPKAKDAILTEATGYYSHPWLDKHRDKYWR